MKTHANTKGESQPAANPAQIFGAIGEVEQVLDAHLVRIPEGATLRLASNDELTVADGVHIDEISVPPAMRRHGIATKGMKALCKLADLHGFVLEGGPVGFSDDPWADKFVRWVKSLGFERDPNPYLKVPHDPKAFCVRRIPRKITRRIDHATH